LTNWGIIIIVHQANGKIILKGFATDTKEKLKIEKLFEKAGVNTAIDLLNLLEVRKPNKMVRIKLYVAEINNKDGYEIKNNWAMGYKNYTRNYGNDAVFEDGYIPALANTMDSAVTLTGGLTAGANLLGNGFNSGLTLNYLSSNGVATILDETELITLENKKSVFHAGGKIYVKTQTTTSEGLPSTELKEIDYGLKLEVEVNSIINDKYIDITITTRQDNINWTNQVEGIPSFTNQSINTYVIIKDKSTIVLGGLVNKNDAKNYWKIPLLGDIPILGTLFKSKDFQSGKSELVFFIIPQIVDPSKNINLERLIKINKIINKKE
jgi:pilus assembly protein CpaC